MSQGAPPALPTLELLWHHHLSPCCVNCTMKKKKNQSERKQYSSSHTNSQPLVCLLTALGWEERAVC